MEVTKTERGFEWLDHEAYPPKDGPEKMRRLVAASSAIGDYPDAMDRPGSSFLWVGDHHHLNRKEVAQLVRHLVRWLNAGTLEVKGR